MHKKSLLELKQNVVDAAQKYYVGEPTISDAEFDEMVDEIKKQAPNDSLVNQVGWGFDVEKVHGKKFDHLYGLVGSLPKIHAVSELPKTLGENITLSSKLDGGSCVAYYKDGKFLHAVSRGNGVRGLIKDLQFKKITEKYTLNIPENFTGAIRGEIVMSNANWALYKQNYPDAKSPRNVATGLFMRDDASEDLKYIDFVTYKIIGSENQTFVSYRDVLDTLTVMGFCVVDYYYMCGYSEILTDDLMLKIFNMWKTYPMDGIVIQGNLSQENAIINYHDIAYKFQAETKSTTVTDVQWTLSRNNILVPVICVEPVELSGAIVSKTSGFNYKYIAENKIGKGSKLTMCRSGEVIPFVLSVDTESEYPKIPTLCPVCGQPLEEDGVNLVCSNENCPNVERSRLITWLEVIGVRDMLGVGSALLNAIIQELEYYYNRKNINIFDLYAENSILYNDEYKTKMLNTFTPSAKEKTEQIFNNLVQSVTVSKVLIALNIYGLGKLTCEKISDNIYAWFVNNDYSEIEKISEIENIGDFVKTTVIKHLNLIGRILSTQKIENVRKDENFGSIAKIAITGALSIPRKQFELICKQHNVEISTNIKQCNFVVTNDSTGNSSKLIKARQYGIPTITEKEFTEKYLCG